MEEWLLLSILVLITASISRIGFKIAGDTNPFVVVFLIELSALLVGALLMIYSKQKLEIEIIPAIGILIIGISVTLLDYFFIRAVQVSNNVSIVSGIMSLAMVVVAVFSFVIFKEQLSIINWVGVLLGTVSLILLAYR
jgi:uncharacterized membrane protein